MSLVVMTLLAVVTQINHSMKESPGDQILYQRDEDACEVIRVKP